MLMMMGRIMIASMMEPTRRVSPVASSRVILTKRTIMTNPNRPYIMEGIPAKSSITGRVMSLAHEGAISAKKIAQDTPRGIAMSSAPAVTISEKNMKGKAPYNPFPGFHSVPSRKSRMLISVNRRPASLKRNTIMRISRREAVVEKMKSVCLTISSFFWLFMLDYLFRLR